MGLTFQQKFYNIGDAVFLATCHNGAPKAILEIPEDGTKALHLKSCFNEAGYKVVVLNFDDLILNGYTILKEMGIKDRRKTFDIY